MSDLYGSLDEKKKKRKKAGSESSKESSLRDWFGRKGAKGKKKGWVDCNAPDGKGGYKSCGRSGGEKRKKYPACRPTPGACKERGKGKSWGKKAKKRKNEELYMDLEQLIQEELEAVIDEKRKKKKKKKKKKSSGKKDACYHKVKSRYKVWPSAYASGALVKCRKVGAKNWGNSKKESIEIEVQNTILEVLNESHTKEDEETLKKMAKKLRGSSKLHADQAEELQDIIDRSPDEELDESHSEKDEKTLEDIAGQLRKASKMHAGQAEKIEKIVSDSDDSELKEADEEEEKDDKKKVDLHGFSSEKETADFVKKNPSFFNEGMNCGCGNDPCDTYGKDGEKIIIMVKEEIEAALDEKKKKKKKKKSAKDRMKCNSSRRIRKGEPGYGKKKFVVKACEGGTEKIIRYGDANMEIKKDSPARRKSFRARHNCKNPGSKLKARYWSCKKW